MNIRDAAREYIIIIILRNCVHIILLCTSLGRTFCLFSLPNDRSEIPRVIYCGLTSILALCIQGVTTSVARCFPRACS